MVEAMETKNLKVAPETSQHQALYLTKSEADRLLAKVSRAAFLVARGIEIYTVSAEPMPMADGSKHDAVYVMVRAETDKACGMGVGFVTAICEGVEVQS